MSGQSGFLDSFLKFLEGDDSAPITRTKPATTRKPIISKVEEEKTPPVKRPRGRPRKKPIVIEEKKEKLNCELEDSLTEKTNDHESLNSADSDSQTTNKSNMLQVLRENFNKCISEKLQSDEANGGGEVSVAKEAECVSEDKKLNGESVSEVREVKTEKNKVNLSPKPGKRKVSTEESSNSSEKEISNSTDKDENVSRDNVPSPAGQSGGQGRKRKSDVQEQVPRRESTARKAKGKPKFSYIESESEDNPDFDEGSNSDDDPVWTPNEKKASSDEEDNFQWKQRQNLLLKSKKITPVPVKNLQKPIVEKVIKVASHGSESKTSPVVNFKKTPVATRSENKHCIDQSMVPFQSGSFIALKEELEDLEEPTLWRVDGKALLQKYEPFRSEDGALRYRNVSTYSGWGPKNRDLYHPVPVKFLYQNRFEYVVEIIKEELIINDDKLREKLVKDLEKYSLSYEVYLQTMVSQALDSNFLNEIVTEKDDYFLTSLDKLDKVSEEKSKKLLRVFAWNEKLKENLSKWPILNIDSKCNDEHKATCQVCCKNSYTSSVDIGGESYSNQTLEFLSPIPVSEEFKTFLTCQMCLENIQLYNRVAHLKYHTYKMCVDLVKEKEASNEGIDNTKILHDILADSALINQKFHEVSLLWAEADLKCRRKKTEEITLS